VAITPDGRKAVSGSSDKTCIIWDIDTGEVLNTLTHTSGITAVAITSNGGKVIFGSFDGTCTTWDLDNFQSINTFKGHTEMVTAIACTPDGKKAISGSNDKTCILWDMKFGNRINILKGNIWAVYAVSITPDGQRAVSGHGYHPVGWEINAGSWDYGFIIWNLNNGHVINFCNEKRDDIKAVAITPDGKRAIINYYGNNCIVIDLNARTATNATKNSFNSSAVMVTRNRGIAISLIGGIYNIWDLDTEQIIKTLSHNLNINELSGFTPDGKKVISISDDTCIIWDMDTGQIINRLKHSFRITDFDITPDGKGFVTGSLDHSCILWDLKTGMTIMQLEFPRSIYSVTISPNGKLAIIVSYDLGFVLDLDTRHVIHTLKGHSKYIDGITITPDGKRAISVAGDIHIIWNLSTGGDINSLRFAYRSTALSITPDGKKAISISGDTCIVWNTNTGEIVHILYGHTKDIETFTITPDGKSVITGSYDNTCIVWNIEEGKMAAIYFSQEHVRTIDYYSCGILGCNSNSIFLFHLGKDLLYPGYKIVTIRQIWDFELKIFLPFSADCPLCGHRFSPPDSILATIENIIKNAGLRPDQSPCLELPDAAWEDPDLLGNCPKCGGELKFNPFIAGEDN